MHFSDKGEILQEICRQAFEQLLSATRRITGQIETSPQERLRDLLTAYAEFGFSHPNAYRLIYLTRPVEARDGAETAAQQLGAELFQLFVSLLAEVQAAGSLRNKDARQAATVIWAGVHGIVSLIITKPYFDWGEREALPPLMIDALIAGLIEDR
jgi:AcrR family transcriptional regulator